MEAPMRTTAAVLIVGCSLLPLSVAWGDSLAYVRASSQLQLSEAPDKYHPLNLLDEDPQTIWCEGAAGVGESESITFFFKTNQKIDRVVIGPTPQSGRFVQLVKISDGVNIVQIELAENYVDHQLKRPMNGSTYSITIEQVGGPNKMAKLDQESACLGDVLLYYKKQLYGGKTPSQKLRYDKMRDRVLGRWFGEPLGASERTLIFALDGTWDWIFKPLMGGKSDRKSGEYRFRNNRLLMRVGETGRWTDMRFKFRRVKVDTEEIGAPKSDYDAISLANDMDDKVGGEYNTAEF